MSVLDRINSIVKSRESDDDKLEKFADLYDGDISSALMGQKIDTDFIKAVTTSAATGDAFKNIPLGRLGQPEDIAYGALFLASDESSFITASELVIDGGVTGIRT